MGPGALSCWIGAITFEFCCTGEYGTGNSACWDGYYTWEACCLPDLRQRGMLVESVSPSSGEVHMTVAATPTAAAPAVAVDGVGADGFTIRQRNKWKCLNQYDDRNNRKWFLAQSGIPTHPFASHGNPASCVQGGHTFWWGLVEIKQGVVDIDGQDIKSVIRDIEFGFCVPESCEYGVVEFLLLPFYVGPYLNKPWGPMPVWLENVAAHPVKGTVSEDDLQNMHKKISDFAVEIKQKPGFLQTHWPYRCGLWKYKATWLPSHENMMLMIGLACPLFIALLLDFLLTACGVSEGRIRRSVDIFSPLQRVRSLTAARGEDSTTLHVMKVILQGLVCWQHAALLIEWTGNEGTTGISSFAPWTHGGAQMMGRVNTCFACLSAHLVVRSVWERASSKSCLSFVAVIVFWCARRWVSQVLELAWWTFYYLRIAPEIPWRPFPEFVQVWYTARMQTVNMWPTGGLPMWLLSALLVYEPVNGIFGWHNYSSSMCHNLAIFETLFGLSCIIAGTLVVRKCFGFTVFTCVLALLLGFSAFRMPVANPYAEVGLEAPGGPGAWRWNLGAAVDTENKAGAGHWRFEVLPATTSRLLPASLLAAFLSAWSQGKEAPGPMSAWKVCLAVVLVSCTFIFDFLTWSQSFVADNWRLSAGHLTVIVQTWKQLMSNTALRSNAAQRVLTLAFEIPHVVGLAMFMNHGDCRGSKAQSPPTLLALFSRLSLGINIANIFVLHYLSGRSHDYSIEFSQAHLTMYAAFAWFVAAILAFCVHCVAVPYTSVLIKLGGGLVGLLSAACGSAGATRSPPTTTSVVDAGLANGSSQQSSTSAAVANGSVTHSQPSAAVANGSSKHSEMPDAAAKSKSQARRRARGN
eukprot:TRINITY_DN63473_c0_g1_i1.p1 TRINITY_DN63473_c0_g1~~TRINITY_DN63473_c0_g1_i1.p1  ORF type:complete len:878 (-),score=75.91 TRINITY_DN63473_c0_g1_i1:176-2758(-)